MIRECREVGTNLWGQRRECLREEGAIQLALRSERQFDWHVLSWASVAHYTHTGGNHTHMGMHVHMYTYIHICAHTDWDTCTYIYQHALSHSCPYTLWCTHVHMDTFAHLKSQPLISE